MNKRNPRITLEDKARIFNSLRRAFSRSELRAKVINKTRVEHSDPKRKRVTRWSFCTVCSQFVPTYLVQADHLNPVISVTDTQLAFVERLTLDEMADVIWCEENNLLGTCKPCHKAKSKSENAQRRANKKALLDNQINGKLKKVKESKK